MNPRPAGADGRTAQVKAGPIRPARPFSPIPVSVAVLGTWWLVAHNSGAGWVQALGDVVFGVIVIGLAGPALVLARTKVRIERAPADAIAGQPLDVRVSGSTRVRVRARGPLKGEAFIGPARSRGPGRKSDYSLLLEPRTRGVHETLALDVASAAPFGLQWWSRSLVLALPAPLHVAPRRGDPVPFNRLINESAGDGERRVPGPMGEMRGARAYRPGDSRRHVHWPASAHTRELMVRELEAPVADPVTVTVNLPADPDQAERVAERALGTVLRLMDRSVAVTLFTTEPTGTVRAAVADRRAAGRRLARAVSGPGRTHRDPGRPGASNHSPGPPEPTAIELTR
jgi:uncharacterized protein (DUF58 family)